MVSKEEVIEVLKKPEVISNHGMEFDEIKDYFDCSEHELKMIIKESKRNRLIVATPFRTAGRWYLKYYSPPCNEESVQERIEDVFTQLAIPLWVKTRVFRGSKVIFVGEIDKEPGFIIIDYNEDPPLIFHSKLAGGERNEITNYRSKSKYLCKRGEEIIWYTYRGERKNEF
jgi:hypothetical protein